jgi:catechol 2,3-dioxygenase-like lactoylglutathione lyase family enzyme
MYSHTTIGANDLARARAFYDAVFAPLGLEVRYSDESFVGWGLPGGQPQFLVAKPFNGERPKQGFAGWPTDGGFVRDCAS